MPYRQTRLKAQVIRLAADMIVVRVQAASGSQRMSGYQFGVAWRRASDIYNRELGIRIALGRAIAACGFDPDHPNFKLLIRAAIKELRKRPCAKLILHSKV